MFVAEGVEIGVGRGNRALLIFSLDNSTSGKIFFIHILEL
jgi:hypothetical protein